ncbi:penicillin acylase family protein [Streptomyces yaizuensis]|uniref:Penicillin acylase family protein n=1 Tax=Streptomyces yaizuensis TaxID=2989713 RepID=A0ABQ5NSJ5_9ACTN|nr:penicillin acylase family protein [Streptomyces sp. YSPA8]GLF93348.1 penicillin acylase family protein [Streptomyces sp. YSPA8]
MFFRTTFPKPGRIPRPRRSLRVLVIAATALATAAVTVPPTAADGPAPPRTEIRAGSGALSATIRYTEYGLPHITARDYAGLGFGTGYAQAADQVCVLADGFATVRAERSRHFGADARPDGSLADTRTNLTSDLLFQGLRDSGTASKLLDRPAPAGPGPQVRELMRGWVRGYNTWLARNTVTDPACRGRAWVRPVSVHDLALVAHALHATAGQQMLAEGIVGAAPPPPGAAAGATAGPAPHPERTARAARDLVERARGTMGSNAVAFHGSTTANGRGLLIGNPHYPWQGGRRFWQAHQTIPGELDVAGATLVASPIVNIGYNRHVAWSHTVSTGTPLTLHRLTLDPGDPTVHLVDGRPERMKKRTVTVRVRGGAPVTRTQWWTRYGPVVTEADGLPVPWTRTHAYALGDPNAAQLRFYATSLAFGKARDTDGVLAALRRTQGLPWVNTVAADSRGGSLFTQSQILPRITDDLAARCLTPLGQATYPSAGLAVLDGSRAACTPGRDPGALQPGVFGPGRMPTLKNAPYAANSNDSAWLAHPDRPLRGYPRVFGDIDAPRSLRTRGGIEDLTALAGRGGLRIADAQRHQFANRAPAGGLAAADLARACAALPGGHATATDGTRVDISAACPALRAWDRTTDTGSRGALLFDRLWRRLTDRVPEERLWKVPFSPADPVRTPHTLDTDLPEVARALADTVRELRSMGAKPDARWGEHHFSERGGTRIPVHGGAHRLGVWNMMEGRWDPAAGGYAEIRHGTSHLQAVTWNGTGCPVARTLLAYGQSSDPTSPHSHDQTRLLSAKKWVTPRFCEKDILASPALRTLTVREDR